jgi:transposase-like protein
MIDTTPESTRPHRITSARSMLNGRRDDSMRRRQRVLAVLDRAGGEGDQISVSAIAHAAGVDRTFLYRHRDLLEKIHALQADPVTDDEHTGPAVTRASLQADLLAAHERIARLGARIQQLEKRLSEALGEQTWRQSGLGAPADIDTLHQRISQLEQHNLELQQQLDEREEDLAAARSANRELMARLNTPTRLR